MGWNSGFRIMEQTVVSLYDEGILTSTLLDKIVEPYKGTDLDHGGSEKLTSKDGLCVDHIICKVMKPEETRQVEENPRWWSDFEENRDTYMENPDPLWVANEAASDLFDTIWRDMWGMW